MTGPKEYRAASGTAEAELKEKGSRFLAVLRPAADQEEAEAALAELARKYRDATHLCWAWRLGSPPRERSSDAGEPHGTAGRPMLMALRGAGISDVVAAVARWYGGVKLGKGGLARAYGGAVRLAVTALASEVRRPTVRIAIEAPFGRLGAVRRLVRPPAVTIEEESYGETACLLLRVERRHEHELRDALAGLGVEIGEPSTFDSGPAGIPGGA